MTVFVVFEENQETEQVTYCRVCSTQETAERVVNEKRLNAEIHTEQGKYPNKYWWQAEDTDA